MIEKLPQHVGIIMDGNRRWAKERNLPISQGHLAGAKRVRPTIETAAELGIDYVTLYTFSQENWKRDPEEVSSLMNVFRQMLSSTDLEDLMENGVKVNMLGDYSEFPNDIKERIEEIHEVSNNNDQITANFALGYGGRDEIHHAVQYLLDSGVKNVTEEVFRKGLYTDDIPDPDLIIRPGGERRTSGFLLYQSAYAEWYFTDVYWPDFSEDEFKLALDDFLSRQRRFGR